MSPKYTYLSALSLTYVVTNLFSHNQIIYFLISLPILFLSCLLVFHLMVIFQGGLTWPPSLMFLPSLSSHYLSLVGFLQSSFLICQDLLYCFTWIFVFLFQQKNKAPRGKLVILVIWLSFSLSDPYTVRHTGPQ